MTGSNECRTHQHSQTVFRCCSTLTSSPSLYTPSSSQEEDNILMCPFLAVSSCLVLCCRPCVVASPHIRVDPLLFLSSLFLRCNSPITTTGTTTTTTNRVFGPSACNFFLTSNFTLIWYPPSNCCNMENQVKWNRSIRRRFSLLSPLLSIGIWSEGEDSPLEDSLKVETKDNQRHTPSADDDSSSSPRAL